MSRSRAWWPLPFGLGVALLPVKAFAQISPGKLSRAHERLEGSAHCLECHERGRGVPAARCFACHQPLQERVGAGKGLHARPEYRECKTCHVEHQGVDADLVWWGKAGRDAFDHRLTGHPLQGKHAQIACAKCHTIRGYVGSPTACSSCHADEHRGQFGKRECASCHAETAWKPASGFDHGTTSWPLTGKHASVACDKCHRATKTDAARPAPASYRVFKTVAGRECASCHEDVHKGRMGQSCKTCHTPGSWRSSVRAEFDHERTAYPLRGRHAKVACDQCHVPGKPLKLAHALCTECHADAHAGQLSRRADGGKCEGCHDVTGFKPARFGAEDHARTSYPLAGAHLAIPCDTCHQTVDTASVRAATGARAAAGLPARTIRFRFASAHCGDCHQDAHRGELARFVKKDGCESCHRVESWRQVRFDHALTRYPLSGGHRQVACPACHRAVGPAATRPAALRFTGIAQDCRACHGDTHQGQFAAAGQTSACDTCHAADTLKASKFDHGRDSAYHLDAAHARLGCAACHRPESRGQVTFVRFKPLPTSCKGCHGSRPVASSGGSR